MQGFNGIMQRAKKTKFPATYGVGGRTRPDAE
jgi:hypothetical protein